MATTDPALAAAALDALATCGVKFAILHREADVASGIVESDVDVVVDRAASAVVAACLPAFNRAGLHVVVLWPYDVGETITLFLATTDASEGVQLDLLHDPRGIGRYGIRSTALIDNAVPGVRWPRPDPHDQLVYLIQKRWVKLQTGSLADLNAEARAASPAQLHASAHRLLAHRGAEELLAFVETGESLAARTPPALAGFVRRVLRLARPIGAWIEIQGSQAEQAAVLLAELFGRFLPHKLATMHPSGRLQEAWWFGRRVAPVKWRAGLVASWAKKPPKLGADLVLQSDSTTMAVDVVAWLEKRVRQRLDIRP